MAAYYSHFKFLGIESKDGEIVARIAEKEAGWFSKTISFTMGESRLRGFFENFDKAKQWADDQSRDALLNAIDAIRTEKLKRGIPFDA